MHSSFKKSLNNYLDLLLGKKLSKAKKVIHDGVSRSGDAAKSSLKKYDEGSAKMLRTNLSASSNERSSLNNIRKSNGTPKEVASLVKDHDKMLDRHGKLSLKLTKHRDDLGDKWVKDSLVDYNRKSQGKNIIDKLKSKTLKTRAITAGGVGGGSVGAYYSLRKKPENKK